VLWFFTFQAIGGEFKNHALCWLLWTSIQKIDLLGMIIGLTRGKSELLAENALLDSTIWILRSR
jgi:hypothetical protein